MHFLTLQHVIGEINGIKGLINIDLLRVNFQRNGKTFQLYLRKAYYHQGKMAVLDLPSLGFTNRSTYLTQSVTQSIWRD